jgi:DNA-binding NarL/FixJ family response regulator
MSQPVGKPFVSIGKPFVVIIDSKNLRRASITSLLEPWAKSENLRLTSFTPAQAREALQADTNFRMLIFSIGGESIAAQENLQQLKVLRALATNAPLVIMSDREDAQDIATAFSTEAQGFIHGGITSSLAYQALSFILNGGSYFPTSAVHHLQARLEQAQNSPPDGSESESRNNGNGANGSGAAHSGNDLGCRPANLTVRQREVLAHVRLGESNKVIARHLGMSEGTVKVHIRQMMRKFHVSNRTQLALDWALATECYSTVDNNLLDAGSVKQNGGTSFAALSSTRQQTPALIGPASRPRVTGKH